ncbi:MAG: DUF5916 domain-containing protein [Bacteroidales bacterium]
MKNFLILTVLFFLFAWRASGQDLPKKIYQATYITTAPSVDGFLTEEQWNQGEWIDDFTQHEPYNGKAATQRTEFKILFDDNNLYVAIKAFDTHPDSITNRLTRRDEADGDLVGIIVDSYHDLRTAFLFGVSSAGVKFDQVFTGDGQNEDSSWDPNWWVKTSINKEGWVAEMKIPFSQVRFEKGSADVWGLELARIIYRNNETDFWQHIPKDAPGLVHLFGELKGLEKIKPRKIFDVTPYGVAKAETYEKDASDPFRSSGRKFSGNAGLDAKIGVTNNLTMDLTVNPDFGQVEADPSVINLSAFETFYKEKRPFFIEGNNITSFGLGIGDGGIGNDNLFYSRRIGRSPQGSANLENDNWKFEQPNFTSILGAAKLTGKTQDGLSVGFINAVTSREYSKIDTVGGRINQLIEPLTNYMVGRVQKDMHEGKTIIGGIFTSTNRDLDANLATFMHKAAYTGGIDFTQYTKNKNWMFSLNAAFSNVQGTKEAIRLTQESSARYFQRPDNNYAKYDTTRTSLSGSGGRAQVMKMNGHWNFMGVVLWKTPGFETNDIGYLREADQLIALVWAGYNQWEPKGIYRRFNINGDVLSFFNFGGNCMLKGFEINGNMTLKNYWQVYTGGSMYTQGYSTNQLRGGPMMKTPGSYGYRFNINTDYRKKLVFSLFAGINGGFNDSQKNLNVNFEASYKPVKFLMISISPNFSTNFDRLQYVSEQYFGGPRYVFGSIDQKTLGTSIRVNVNMSPNLTLQYWGQPFVASGRFYDYKYITDPMADRFRDRFHTYIGGEIKQTVDGFDIDENNDTFTDYSISRNDFNYQAFLSNLVLRWEYSPGSSVYVVWSQTRYNSTDVGKMDYFNNVKDLFGATATNVFLVKFSYRFGLK